MTDRKLPDGYHHRLSGAAMGSQEPTLKCDGCNRLVTGVIGWEKEGEPDKWLCLECNVSETKAAYPKAESPPPLGVNVSETIATKDRFG